MKRFVVVLALTATVLGVMLCFCPQPFQNYIAVFPKDAEICIYCRNATQDAIALGNGYLVQCHGYNFTEVFAHCNSVDGISVKFRGTQQDFLRAQAFWQLQVEQSQQLETLAVVCGSSKRVANGVFVEGKFVNLQMAFDGETITVGSPLILDSF